MQTKCETPASPTEQPPRLFSEFTPVPRADFVSIALAVLQGGTTPAMGTLPEQHFEPSKHRLIPVAVTDNAAARPPHQCTLSDGSTLRQPLDVMFTAAETGLEILNRWLHYTRRGHPLSDVEKSKARAQARAMAAAVILLDDIRERVERYVRPFGGAERVAGFMSSTYHAWCADAARSVLQRAFPHPPLGCSVATALSWPDQALAEVRAEWFGTITREDLVHVRRRVLGEFSEAWKRFADDEANAAEPKRLAKIARDKVLLALFRSPKSTWQDVSRQTEKMNVSVSYDEVRRVGSDLKKEGLVETKNGLHDLTRPGKREARGLAAPTDDTA